jgi:TolB protein
LIRYARAVVTLAVLAWAGSAQAILTVEVTKGVEAGLPIAIVPFEWSGAAPPPQAVADVIEADLVRSGRFDSIPRQDFLSQPHEASQVNLKDWRLLKAEALVVGRVQAVGPDTYQVQFQLLDVFKGGQLAGYRYTVPGARLRKLAHQISDIIYEKLTGEPGAFDTRIAYITVEQEAGKRRFLLQVADSDGYNPQTVLDSPEPMMSPAWSPDGQSLAYVSFENRRPIVFTQNLYTRQRVRLADFRGINSAPAWSPDGRRLALVLSKDGNPEIYVMDVATKALTRLTNNLAIDTEPVWSPDGRSIVFTSDRSGRPQIYRMGADGGNVQRLTFEGDYNGRASFSPDGKMLALVTADRGRFQIGVLRLRDNVLQRLTGTALDESPSFAPNGRMILYATERQGRGVLAVISPDGRSEQTLKFQEGDVREPAWSPKTN